MRRQFAHLRRTTAPARSQGPVPSPAVRDTAVVTAVNGDGTLTVTYDGTEGVPAVDCTAGTAFDGVVVEVLKSGSVMVALPLPGTGGAQPGDYKFSRNPTQPGWLLCDGSSHPESDSPALYVLLGGTGGHFNVPDRRGRMLVGANGPGTNSQPTYAVGATGGEQVHTLTVAEMPAHHHTDVEPSTTTVTTAFANGTNNFTQVGRGAWNTGDTGGGGAHNNMPPFGAELVFIKA